MSDPLGRTESLKKRLITLIENAIGGNPYFGHVTGNWDDVPRMLTRLPVASVRVGPIVPADEHYGLMLQSSNASTDVGRYEHVHFTIHVLASACKDSSESEDRYVHQVSDAITDYLEQHRFNQAGYEISDIDDVTKRESNLERSNAKRVIIEGRLNVRKTQSYYYSDAFDYIILAD